MNEQQIKELGYQLASSYDHDQFHTNEYVKGNLLVSFTYEGSELIVSELIICDIELKNLQFNELRVLTEILAKTTAECTCCKHQLTISDEKVDLPGGVTFCADCYDSYCALFLEGEEDVIL
ncbi:MAG: hypothetical protein ACK5JD_11020 [Mangrovibacterium sp.]